MVISSIRLPYILVLIDFHYYILVIYIIKIKKMNIFAKI